MAGLLQWERMWKASGALLSCWLIAGVIYTEVFANAVGSKGRGLHFLFEVLLAGLLGRTGATALFVILGLFAATAILLSRDPS